jgi:hypothetical protein
MLLKKKNSKENKISTISVVSSLPPISLSPFLRNQIDFRVNKPTCVCVFPSPVFYRNLLFYLPHEEWIPFQLFAESNMLSGCEEALSVSATGQLNRQTLNRWEITFLIFS